MEEIRLNTCPKCGEAAEAYDILQGDQLQFAAVRCTYCDRYVRVESRPDEVNTREVARLQWNSRTPIERLAILEDDIPELVTCAKVGRRFIEIAKQYMAATCDASKKEATAYPFWTVEYKMGESLGGIFFSRQAAEESRQSKRNPNNFAVRCESGKYSEAYEELLDLAQTILGGDPS